MKSFADLLRKCKYLLVDELGSRLQFDRYEIWADLYFRRFGKLAPGKLEGAEMLPSSEDTNRLLWDAWHASGLATHDAIVEVARLRALLEEVKSDVSRVQCQMEDLLK